MDTNHHINNQKKKIRFLKNFKKCIYVYNFVFIFQPASGKFIILILQKKIIILLILMPISKFYLDSFLSFPIGWSHSHQPSLYFVTFYSVYLICIPPTSSKPTQRYCFFIWPSKSYGHGEWTERMLSGPVDIILWCLGFSILL